jgi:hypothetical protein
MLACRRMPTASMGFRSTRKLICSRDQGEETIVRRRCREGECGKRQKANEYLEVVKRSVMINYAGLTKLVIGISCRSPNAKSDLCVTSVHISIDGTSCGPFLCGEFGRSSACCGTTMGAPASHRVAWSFPVDLGEVYSFWS